MGIDSAITIIIISIILLNIDRQLFRIIEPVSHYTFDVLNLYRFIAADIHPQRSLCVCIYAHICSIWSTWLGRVVHSI